MYNNQYLYKETLTLAAVSSYFPLIIKPIF